MGIETAIIVGLSAATAVSGMMSANAQSKALRSQQEQVARTAEENARRQAEAAAKEGKLVAENKAIEIARKESAARASYLSSGLGFSGTVEKASEDIFETGLKDIKQIGENYSNTAYNTSSQIIGSARNQVSSLQTQIIQKQAEGRNALISGVSTMAMPMMAGGMGGSTYNSATGSMGAKSSTFSSGTKINWATT